MHCIEKRVLYNRENNREKYEIQRCSRVINVFQKQFVNWIDSGAIRRGGNINYEFVFGDPKDFELWSLSHIDLRGTSRVLWILHTRKRAKNSKNAKWEEGHAELPYRIDNLQVKSCSPLRFVAGRRPVSRWSSRMRVSGVDYNRNIQMLSGYETMFSAKYGTFYSFALY